jgi:methylenetetrahydrofolate dehydrogenase (NADP+)/methenyltetrahydrofolate cyclohydrolase
MILDGKVVAASIKERLKDDIDEAVGAGMRRPRLVIISIGDDPASKVYVRNKLRVAEEVGIIATPFHMTEDIDSEYVKDIIYEMNLDGNIDGIMVQLPLPEHLNEREIIDAILPFKDVDGLTTVNIGRLRSGQDCLKPCTAQGIIDLCKYYDVELDGKDVTIVGRSNIVGKPLADLMMAEGATVTQCHSHTRDLEVDTTRAEILVSAIGKPKFINDDYVGFGAVIIDVGINRDEEGKLCGDVDFEDVKWKVQHITPVPGGVGPMTVAELMVNVVKAWKDNR